MYRHGGRPCVAFRVFWGRTAFIGAGIGILVIGDEVFERTIATVQLAALGWPLAQLLSATFNFLAHLISNSTCQYANFSIRLVITHMPAKRFWCIKILSFDELGAVLSAVTTAGSRMVTILCQERAET